MQIISFNPFNRPVSRNGGHYREAGPDAAWFVGLVMGARESCPIHPADQKMEIAVTAMRAVTSTPRKNATMSASKVYLDMMMCLDDVSS